MRDPLQSHVEHPDHTSRWRQMAFEAKFGQAQAAFLLQEKYVAREDNAKKLKLQAQEGAIFE